jgi:hypothetical protein
MNMYVCVLFRVWVCFPSPKENNVEWKEQLGMFFSTHNIDIFLNNDVKGNIVLRNKMDKKVYYKKNIKVIFMLPTVRCLICFNRKYSMQTLF